MAERHLDEVDVVILGGGVAGLGLASQLRISDPDIRVAVVEKSEYPVPEAAHKVGESTLPISARYFSEVVGLREHLQKDHIPKFGLRYFGSFDGNRDIARRPEQGVRRPVPLPSFQLDHGRLENALAKRATELGATVIDGTRVSGVELGDPLHEVTLKTSDDSTVTVSGKWLVDASGRAAILKRKLGLDKPPTHRGQAAWFRVADRVAVDDWSSDPEWQSRVYGPERWRGTVHLHGRGYWVWLIPLGSGSTSIGLVTDPEIVPFERMRRFDDLMEWLRENEPQVAEAVEERKDLIQDFRTRKEYPRGSEQVFSPDRWFITGDAGIFLDPLYSPGMDYISISNTFINGIIMEEREGRPGMEERIATADGLFRTFAEIAFGLYERQYELFGNAEIMSAKVTWEAIAYFAIGAPVAFAGDQIEDPVAFPQKIGAQVSRYTVLISAFHTLLREWDEVAGNNKSVGMIAAVDDVMDGMQARIVPASKSEAATIELIEENVEIMQRTFEQLVEGVAGALGFEAPEECFETDQDLVDFRLKELPKSDRTVAPVSTEDGISWATEERPDGALNDHMSAWPSLIGDHTFPAPGLVPNALYDA